MNMPIYFNISAHFWILYVLVFNGLAASQSLCLCSTRYRELVESFEARVLSGFFISILINGAGLLALQTLGIDFVFMRYLLPIYSCILLILPALLLRSNKTAWRSTIPEFGLLRLLLYLFVFFILFYNGGLIEQIADSWWHLSLANKTGMLSTLDARHHLTGVPMRFYPPLWHGNLAVLHKMSDISLPVLWNAFTAWGGSLKVMAFYLLALGVSRDRAVAVLSALLFVLLPGLGDSYLRVSAWPSHISYTAWFCLFYVTFAIFDKWGNSEIASGKGILPGSLKRCLLRVKQNREALLSFAALSLIVLCSHLAELFWFGCGILFYALALRAHRLLPGSQSRNIEPAARLLYAYLFWGLVGIVAVTCLTYYPPIPGPVFSDINLVPILLLGTAFSFLYLLSEKSPVAFIYNEKAAGVLLLFVLLSVLLSVDMRQLLSLFHYELSYGVSRHFEAPVLTTGWLGGQLQLPGWHMQLRGGLLYSGALAIVVSVFMAIVRPNRGTLFLAADAVIPFLFLVSPYLYQWLSDVLAYTSSWRIGLLIFHPIVLAVFILYLWENITSGKKDSSFKAMMKQAVALFVLLPVLFVVGRDAVFHFDDDVVAVKRDHHSPQRHWNIGYDPRYVFYDSPFRYQKDLAMLSVVVEPGYAVLSDLATSYYAAATLPVYVLNVQRHHRSKRAERLAKVLDNGEFCYLEDPFHRQAALDFLQRDARAAEESNWPALRYVLLNKDKENSMLRDDCLALRSGQLESSLLRISRLVYEGEYLNIYQLNTFSDDRPAR